MATQKRNKKFSTEIVGIFECLLPRNPSYQSSLLFDFSRSYGRLLDNPKTGASRDLFLPENDFKTNSAVNFPKKHPDVRGLETNQRHETQTRIFFHMSFYIWAQYNTKIVLEHLQSDLSFQGKIFKKSAEKAERLNFTIFWALYFWKY